MLCRAGLEDRHRSARRQRRDRAHRFPRRLHPDPGCVPGHPDPQPRSGWHPALHRRRPGRRHRGDPSHNPPTDGGFKYDRSPAAAPSDVTNAIADRANELLGDFKNIKRVPFEQAVKSDLVERFDFREHYVADLENVIDFDVIRSSGVRLGIDPLGGASVNYWPLMNEKFNLTIDVVRPQVDPTWSFMTIDHDGKIRMDPSSRTP